MNRHVAIPEPIVAPAGCALEGLRYAKRIYQKTARGRARNTRQELTVLEVCYERISVEPFREPPGAEASAKNSLADADRHDQG